MLHPAPPSGRIAHPNARGGSSPTSVLEIERETASRFNCKMKPTAKAFLECHSFYRCRKSSPHRTSKLSTWLVPCTVGLLLAVLCLDPVSSTTASISCTYASSCNDQCSSVCPHGKFTPFLPSTCSPEGQV